MGIWPKSPEGKGQLWTDYQKCCRQQSESGTCSVHPLHFGQTIKLPERFTELWLYTSDSGRQWRFISDVSDTVFAWMGFTVHFRVLMNYGFQAQTTLAYILTDPLIICVILGNDLISPVCSSVEWQYRHSCLMYLRWELDQLLCVQVCSTWHSVLYRLLAIIFHSTPTQQCYKYCLIDNIIPSFTEARDPAKIKDQKSL